MTAPMETDRSTGRDKSRDRGMAHRRALAVGIGASAVLHIIVVLLYSIVITQWGPSETILAVESPTRFSDDMRIVRLIELLLPELTVEPPEDPAVLTAEAELEATDVGPPVPAGAEFSAPPRGRRASDVLRVRSSDARLWRQALPELFQLTLTERMQLQLAGRLEEWTDSVAEVIAAELALTDWTTTDDQGRRWGVSPGQLHLGDITLPLPFYFSGNSWQREIAGRRAWEDQTIRDGANMQALRASWEERAEAIRRRQDRVREEEDTDPPPPEPVRAEGPLASDTTGAPGR